jgi:hypothetical protein
LEATSDYKYITSDNPVYYIDPSQDPRSFHGVGLINENIEVTFPLSKELTLLATWKKYLKTYLRTNNKLVKEINQRSIMSADKYVFAHNRSESLNKIVQRYKGSAPVLRVG